MASRAPLGLLLLTGLGLVAGLLGGCGRPLGLAAARAPQGLAVRAEGWARAVKLADFQDPEAPFEFFGPLGHPFIDPVTFTQVQAKGAGSVVLEALAPPSSKPRKGRFLNFEVEEVGSFLREKEGGKEGEQQLAKAVKVGFRWAVNGAEGSEPSTFLEAIYVVQHKTQGLQALGYGWTSRACPGAISGQLLQAGGKPIPLRVISLSTGAGLGQACGEAALHAMRPEPVERDLITDLRWAFGGHAAADGEAGGEAPSEGPPEGPSGGCPPGASATPPASVSRGPNAEYLGVVAVGAGAEVGRGVCTHALLDDLWVQCKF